MPLGAFSAAHPCQTALSGYKKHDVCTLYDALSFVVNGNNRTDSVKTHQSIAAGNDRTFCEGNNSQKPRTVILENKNEGIT
jgi:hypothetical protein